MTREELLQASDSNAVAALRHFTGRAGGETSDTDGVLLAASVHPYCGTFHNAAVRTDPKLDAKLALDQAREFFARRARDFVLWIADHADRDLEEAAQADDMPLRRPPHGAPGMVCTSPLEPAQVPEGVNLVPVQDAEQVKAFAAVVAEAYTAREEPPRAEPAADSLAVGVVDGDPQPPEAALTMFENPAVLLSPETFAVLASTDGEAASCAVLYQSDDVAGVYWVSTRKAARRRGLGDLVTRAVINEGFRRGARVAVLQSSSMGTPIYERMGFVEVTRYRRYLGHYVWTGE